MTQTLQGIDLIRQTEHHVAYALYSVVQQRYSHATISVKQQKFLDLASVAGLDIMVARNWWDEHITEIEAAPASDQQVFKIRVYDLFASEYYVNARTFEEACTKAKQCHSVWRHSQNMFFIKSLPEDEWYYQIIPKQHPDYEHAVQAAAETALPT